MENKYKVLISGMNTSIIDDLFNQLDDSFEFMTTSMRLDDLKCHLHYMEPDIFVYAIGNEPAEVFQKMFSQQSLLQKSKVIFALIGSDESINDFSRASAIAPDIVLHKPITARDIRQAFIKFIEDRERVAREIEEARIAALRAQEENRKHHVLVVDDDPMMLKLIKEHLKDDYSVGTAPSGRVALKFLETKTTDLILLDYEMPIEDGPTVLKKLRENDATKDIPVVFLTGVTDREKIQQALVLKPQGYILKPIDKEKLMLTIKEFVK